MKRFIKKIEDFICGHCGKKTKGNGYTNHCSKCLWSKHVDINPGDRAEECLGLMEPVGLEFKAKEFTLIHKCASCGIERRCKTTDKDDINALTNLSKKIASDILGG